MTSRSARFGMYDMLLACAALQAAHLDEVQCRPAGAARILKYGQTAVPAGDGVGCRGGGCCRVPVDMSRPMLGAALMN